MRGLDIGKSCNLQVGQWAAILVGGNADAQEVLGTPSGEDAIPPAIRRRMGRLERLAVRCTLGVLRTEGGTDELIFCSRYGNVEALCSLLGSIAAREPMSPMVFSGSVHNAVPGLVGQIRKERLSHTALAAGRQTFIAGLMESYALLAADACRDVTLTFTDLALPDVYHDFEDEDRPGIAMALRLALAVKSGAATTAKPGRAGVFSFLDGLKAGAMQIALDESSWIEPVS